MFPWTGKIQLNFGCHPHLDHKYPKSEKLQFRRTVYCILFIIYVLDSVSFVMFVCL